MKGVGAEGNGTLCVWKSPARGALAGKGETCLWVSTEELTLLFPLHELFPLGILISKCDLKVCSPNKKRELTGTASLLEAGQDYSQ